jgi:hypothetical protein
MYIILNVVTMWNAPVAEVDQCSDKSKVYTLCYYPPHSPKAKPKTNKTTEPLLHIANMCTPQVWYSFKMVMISTVHNSTWLTLCKGLQANYNAIILCLWHHCLMYSKGLLSYILMLLLVYRIVNRYSVFII